MTVLFDPDIERAVLGVLLHGRADDLDMANLLAPNDFGRQQHRRIFEAIVALAGHGETVDAVTVASELRRVHQLDAAGGQEYINELAFTVASLGHLDRHIAELRALSNNRYVVHLSDQLGKAALASDNDKVAGIVATLTQTVDGMTNGSKRELPAGALVTTVLATIAPEKVSWIWPGYLPLGKIVTLDGMPDLGKSTISVDIASRVTTGLPMPDGSASEIDGPADVVLFTAEDGLADTVRPRVDSAGGDPNRIHVVRAAIAVTGEGKRFERWPSLATDIASLERLVDRTGARLVVVDVLMSYLGTDVNSYRDQDMRAVLSPLASMAERAGCTVVLLRHPTKSTNPDPVLSGGGSIGISGAARVGLIVGFDPDDSETPTLTRRRLLAVAKCNIAPKATTLSYGIRCDEGDLAAHIAWGTATKHRADEIVAAQVSTSGRDDSDTDHIVRQLMGDLPMLATDAAEECKAAGIKPDTARRALLRLGGSTHKLGHPVGGGPPGWAWFSMKHPPSEQIIAMKAEASRRADMPKADENPKGVHGNKHPPLGNPSALGEERTMLHPVRPKLLKLPKSNPSRASRASRAESPHDSDGPLSAYSSGNTADNSDFGEEF